MVIVCLEGMRKMAMETVSDVTDTIIDCVLRIVASVAAQVVTQPLKSTLLRKRAFACCLIMKKHSEEKVEQR